MSPQYIVVDTSYRDDGNTKESFTYEEQGLKERGSTKAGNRKAVDS